MVLSSIIIEIITDDYRWSSYIWVHSHIALIGIQANHPGAENGDDFPYKDSSQGEQLAGHYDFAFYTAKKNSPDHPRSMFLLQ